MSSDDQSAANESRRNKLLEEIKRRAEEAELQRIEDEEKEGKAPQKRESAPGAEAAPFPAPASQPPRVSSQKAREQKASVLRDRMVIALERGRIDKAEELLGELESLVPNDPDIAEYRERIRVLREERARTKELSRSPAPVPPPSQTPRPPVEPVKPGKAPKQESARPARQASSGKPVGELLEAAQVHYQQERYDKGLQVIEEVLEREPDNQVAAGLKEQIIRAKEITEMVRKEEERRRADERVEDVPVVPEPGPRAAREGDFWGASTKPAITDGFELAPQEAGPAAPPRRPVGDRLAGFLTGIRIPWKPILAVAVIVAGAYLIYNVVDFIRTAVSPPRATILVLPPTYPAVDSTFAYVADGLAEDVMSGLAMAKEVRVVGPVTALGLRNSTVSNVRMARSLGAGYFLQWSIKNEPAGMVAQCALFDTVSTNPLWVNSSRTPIAGLPKLRLDLVYGILSTVDVPSGDATSRLLHMPSLARPEAYESFLRGTFVLRNRGRYPAAIAADYFAEAIRVDSTFAQAHAAFGWATMLANEASAEPSQAAIARALASVQAAMGLGWTTSETFRVWGMAELFRGQYEKARERFDEAAAMSPSDAEAQRRLAVACIATGEYDAAVLAAQAAVQIDPGNAASHITLGNVHQFLGQYVYAGIGKGGESRDELASAVRAYEQGIRFAADRSAYTSGLYAEALVYVQQAGRSAELMADRVARVRSSAIDLYRLARIEQAAGYPRQQWMETLGRALALVDEDLRFDPGDAEAFSVRALIQTRLGQFKEAQDAIRSALQLTPANVEVLVHAARMYALQREKVRALDMLRRALNRKYSLPALLDMDLYNLRSEEGFLAAVSA